MVRLKLIKRRSGLFKHWYLYLTVETILSPNLAKSVVGGRLPTTSTICSPPPVVPQEGLSREMKLSSPFFAAVFKAKFCVGGWTTIGLVDRGGLRGTLDVLEWKSFPDIPASNALVESAERLGDTSSGTVPALTTSWRLAVAGCQVIVNRTLKLVF